MNSDPRGGEYLLTVITLICAPGQLTYLDGKAFANTVCVQHVAQAFRRQTHRVLYVELLPHSRFHFRPDYLD